MHIFNVGLAHEDLFFHDQSFPEPHGNHLLFIPEEAFDGLVGKPDWIGTGTQDESLL
jgi:hypothetical protein